MSRALIRDEEWSRGLGAEFAGGEGFEGAEAGVEFGGGEAALAVEGAEKIGGGAVALAGVAFEAGGNQVAVRIAAEARAGHDVVEALHAGGSAAKAIEANAALAIVNGFAQGPGLQEVGGFQGGGRKFSRGTGVQGEGRAIFVQPDGVDIFGPTHFDEMAGFAAFEETQSAELIKAADRLAHGSIGETELGGDRHYRKLQAELADHERVAEQMGIDGAIENGQAETGGEDVFKLHPEETGIEFFRVHVRSLQREIECEKRGK